MQTHTKNMTTLALLLAMGPMNDAAKPKEKTALDILNGGNPDDRNIRQIDMALGEIKDEFDGIMAVAPENRTPAQYDRAKELANLATDLKKEKYEIMQNATDPPSVDEALRETGDTHTAWRDNAGRDVHVLSPAENYANLRSPGSGDALPFNSRPSVGNYIRGAITGDWSNAQHERELFNLSTTTGGGAMIPETIGRMIVDLARANSAVIAAGAQTVDMTASKMTLVRVTSDPAIAGVAENAEIPESDPGIDGVVFQAKKQGVLVRVSRELLYDSPNAGQVVESVMGAAMGARVDQVALDGDGVGANPTGLLNIAGVNEVAVGGNPSWDDWVDGVQEIEEANGMAPSTVMSPAVKSYLAKLKDGQGRYLNPPAMLNDLSRYTSTKLADTTATIGDFSQLLIGVWHNLEFAYSGYAKDAFEKDQVMFRILWRGDVAAIRPNHFSKLTGISLA